MKLIIDKNRKVYSAGTWGTKNENNYEILDFEFPEELEEYNKRIVYYLDDKRVWDAIVYNKAYITNAITKYEKVNAYVWLTKNETITLKYVCDGTEEGNYYFTYDNVNYYFTMPEVEENDELIFDVATSTLKLDNTTIATTTTGTGTELTFETIIDAEEDFRTQLFKMQFYENENADGIVPTPEQVDGFNTMLTAMNEKIEEIDELETTIENAETQRQENEETRQENESTRQENEQTRQEQEAERERRTDEAIGEIEDLTEEYNQNAQQKTEAFNNNATQKTDAFNSNVESKTSTFNTNATNKTNDFNSNASSKTTAFNNNATSKTNTFNSNANDKTSAFNDNATQKTTNFDNNASSKTNDFNSNAASKTNDFNDNASAKTTAFNENALAKTEAFDEHTEDIQESLDDLAENMVEVTTEQATEITITDAARWNRNKIQIFGNTEQDSTSIAEGDEYDSPTPEHPQPIHVVTGNNTIKLSNANKNFFNVSNSSYSYGTLTFALTNNVINISIGEGSGGISQNSQGDYTNYDFDTTKDYYFSVYRKAGDLAFNSDTQYKWFRVVIYIKYSDDSISNNHVHITNGMSQESIKLTFTEGKTPVAFAIGRYSPSNTLQANQTAQYNVQLEEGSSATSYVPYAKTNYPFNLGNIELCKIGDYQDYIYKEDGNWYKYNAIEKYVYNNNLTSNGITDTKVGMLTPELNIKANIDQLPFKNVSYCNMIPTTLKNNTGCSGTTSGKKIRLYISTDYVTTYTEFKALCEEKNLTIYFVAYVPTSTQITDANLIAQLEQIYNYIKLTKGTNNITITASDLLPYMKLTYKKPIQPELNDLQSQIDDLNQEVEDLNQEVSELSENMPWTETEQETSINITDAAKYSKNKMKVFGNTEQANYSGKNLFNGNYQAATVGGVNGRTYQTSTAGRTAVIPCLSNTAYTITKYESSDRYRIYDSSEEPVSGLSLNVLANQDSADTRTITTNADANYLIVYVSTSSEQAEPTMQIEQGSTATDYEPYVGGQPAPNPDYPQPIHVVTGNNTIGVTGKNLLDTSNATQTGTSQGITATRNADGTYTFIGTSTSVTINIFIYGNFAIYNNYTNWEDFDKTKIVFDIEPGTYTITDMVLFIIFEDGTKMTTSIQFPTRSKTFTITKKGHVVAVRTPQVQNNTQYDIILYPQLEKGSTATSYEPYAHTDYSLNLGSLELCKIGNYQDYIYKENGNWYKYGAINKVVLVGGDESWSTTSATGGNRFVCNTYYDGLIPVNQATIGSVLSNKFKPTSANQTASGHNGIAIAASGKLVIFYDKAKGYTNSEFKTWLSTNNVTAYYALATATSTQITDETLIAQLEAIYNHLALVKGTNHITITPSDLEPYVTLNYMQDLPSKLDNLDSRLSLLE